VTSQVATQTKNLMELDAAAFAAKFNREPFLVGHQLNDHPLFQLERLVELAKRLPPENVKYTTGDAAIDQGLYKAPQTGLSVEETIEQIEGCRSWMVLKFVETDAEYRDLLHQCLDEIGAHSEKLYPGMMRRSGFIFVSSPGSVTPFHIDPEFNFLLQVRGTKIFHAWNETDRDVLAERDLEQNYLQGGGYHLPFSEAFLSRAKTFTLRPGDGLHVPVNAPHWVKVENEVSISFSITFHTPWTERREAVYAVNGKLRRLKLRPAPFGHSALADNLKYNAARVLRRAKLMSG
jgi:hypothetical protein